MTRQSITFAAIVATSLLATASLAQTAAPRPATTPPYNSYGLRSGTALYDLKDNYLRWALPQGGERYGRIDGADLKRYVDQLADISIRYRDAGHPQYWGRIQGTSGDAETQHWLLDQFRQIGLEQVRAQPFDMKPMQLPDRWTVQIVSKSGEAFTFETAYPFRRDMVDALALEAPLVSAGLGEPLDILGRDIAGKIALIHATPEGSAFMTSASLVNAMQNLKAAGAVGVILSLDLPGNVSGYLGLPPVLPYFVVSREEGDRARAMLVADGGQAVGRMSLTSTVIEKPTTALIWGVLPGATDETIYVVAHRDGYFEAAMDNGSGIATMLGLAKYYAAIPQAQRRRTMIFVGTPGHHDGSYTGIDWMAQNGATLFDKTALIINAEHTSYTSMQNNMGRPVLSNALPSYNWSALGSPKLQQLVVQAFRDYGVATNALPDDHSYGEAKPISTFAPTVQVISGNWTYHTTADTPDHVPAEGLEASTRAYARLIDNVNEAPLSELVEPKP